MSARTLTLTAEQWRLVDGDNAAPVVDSDGQTVSVAREFTTVLDLPVCDRRLLLTDREIEDLARGEVWVMTDRADRSCGWTVRVAL